MKAWQIGLALLLCSGQALAVMQQEAVSYKDGDVELNGVIFWDDAFTGKRPGVLVVHEWWGHNDYARKRADMLAELGYIAFAADVYGKGAWVLSQLDWRPLDDGSHHLRRARWNPGGGECPEKQHHRWPR